jgi:hypothetical protein
VTSRARISDCEDKKSVLNVRKKIVIRHPIVSLENGVGG